MSIPVTAARRERGFERISPYTCNTCIHLRDNKPHPCLCALDGEVTKRQSWCKERVERSKKGKSGPPKA